MKRTVLILFFLVLGLISYYLYPEEKLPNNILIDKLVVFKSDRLLHAYSKGDLIKSYKISLGGKPIGHKVCENDNKTPEGIYFITDKNANSGYHKNLHISYPNKSDKLNARKLGLQPGGGIKIHGLKNNLGFLGRIHRWYDWTEGCIAITDNEIDELFNAVKIGAEINIKP
jgi:murein L,D-transpeptidase YafK